MSIFFTLGVGKPRPSLGHAMATETRVQGCGLEEFKDDIRGRRFKGYHQGVPYPRSDGDFLKGVFGVQVWNLKPRNVKPGG